MPRAGERLTERELECVQLIAQGGSDASVARDLGIEPGTARFHIVNARTKLKAKTRAHLVKLAIAAGVLAP